MNAQEIFDKVSEYLLDPNTKYSYDRENSVCMYRGPNGTKCAVGFLIPDDCYVPEMDCSVDGSGTGVSALWDRFSDVLPDYFGEHLSLLDQLQFAHDVEFNWEGDRIEMIKDLKRIAAEHNLNFNHTNKDD